MHWREYSGRLAELRYRPVPIAPGKKYPAGVDGWERYTYSPGDEGRWPNWGVGLLTGELVAVDIDVLDRDLVGRLLKLAVRTLGRAPVRIGKAPKSLLIYRTAEPRSKKKLKLGEAGHIEILGVGQQFVAYAVHPDTQRPYQWHWGEPLAIPFDSLPLVTSEQVDAFMAQAAEAAGVNVPDTRVLSPPAPPQPAPPLPPSDLAAGLEWPYEKCLAYLKHIKIAAGEYERWRDIGWGFRAAAEAARVPLETAFNDWHEWCRTQPRYDGVRPCRLVWDSYDPNRPNGITAATFYHEALRSADLVEVVGAVDTAFRDAAAQINRELTESWEAEVDKKQAALKERAELERQALDILERELVYIRADCKYFDIRTKSFIKELSGVRHIYRSRMPRITVQRGKRVIQEPLDPLELLESSETKTIADNVAYNPSKGDVFEQDGLVFANTFRPFNPEPLKPTAEELAQIRWWLDWTFPKSDDNPDARRAMEAYLCWLAWPTVRPDKKIRWAPLFAGREGNGKTLALYDVPSLAVFGPYNCRKVVDAEYRSGFSAFLNHWLIYFDELRMGANRNEAIAFRDRLNNLITDRTKVSIAKGRDGQETENFLIVAASSNHEDALHLSATDRRWFVYWMDAPNMSVVAHERDKFFAFIRSDRGPGVFRWFIRECVITRSWFERFDPNSDPPTTRAKASMIELSIDPIDQQLREWYEERQPPFNRDLTRIELVRRRLSEAGYQPGSVQAIANRLKRLFDAKMVRSNTARYYLVRNIEAWQRRPPKEWDDHILNGIVPPAVARIIEEGSDGAEGV